MSEHHKNDTAVVRTCCAVFFILFTFIYLYDYQADIMSVTQHVLSDGATHYNRTVGAVIITFTLWLVHLVTLAITKLRRSAYALTYFPALLLLAILTDITPNVANESYLGNWIWGFPLIMLLYAFVVYICRQLESLEQDEPHHGLFSRLNWSNLFIMLMTVFMVGCIGCSDEVFHWRMRMENCIIDHDYDRALQAGIHEEETDSSLTMLRAWALAEKGQLGDKLFTYPVTPGSASLLPNGTSVCLLMAPTDSLWRFLGVKFKQSMPARTYLEKIHEKRWATKPAHDYLLCAYLMDGDIDKFAKALPKYYHVNDSLPLHYREALTLYTHRKAHPRIVYHNTVMDADYDDFTQIIHKYTDPRERNTMLRDSYGKTYWYFYYMGRRFPPMR